MTVTMTRQQENLLTAIDTGDTGHKSESKQSYSTQCSLRLSRKKNYDRAPAL